MKTTFFQLLENGSAVIGAAAVTIFTGGAQTTLLRSLALVPFTNI